MNIQVFKDMVEEKTGLTFDSTRAELVEKEVSATIARKKLKSIAELYLLLAKSEPDFIDFVKNLTVNETYFFREPSYLELLTERLLNDIKKTKSPDSKIKIISAGCSTGEEPYTIAIALMERFGKGISHFISILGLDIDTDALDKARDGLYGRYSFRGVKEDIVQKYFNEKGSGKYVLKSFVRNAVEFKSFNLLGGDYSESLSGVDIMFYRNVSIYFSPDTQKKIFSNLSSLIRPGGYMVLASSETLSHKEVGTMKLMSMDGLFVYQKPNRHEDVVETRTEQKLGDAHHTFKFAPPVTRKLPKSKPTKPHSPINIESKAEIVNKLLNDTTSFIANKKYDRALELTDKLVEMDGGFVKAYILRSSILMNLNRMNEAKESCMRALELDDLSRESYLMLGLIAKSSGNASEAVTRFQKALYVQSDCWLSHFNLAEVYSTIGKYERAWKHYSNVLRILERNECAMESFDIFPLSFGKEHLIHLCRKKLENLQAV